MLDEFLCGLSNEAQLQIALRFSELAEPIWAGFYKNNWHKLGELNELANQHRVSGAYDSIEVDLLKDALREVQDSYGKARTRSKWPVPEVRKSAQLWPLLLTFLGPLTSPGWDELLPESVRLPFTSVWNILTWLLHRERNDAGETHIYVAVNQAADALMREKIYAVQNLNQILSEYSSQKRRPEDDAENAIRYPEQKSSEQHTNEAYQKIIGPVDPSDPPSIEQALELLRQMKEEGKSYADAWEEYHTGTSVHYCFDREKNQFKKIEMDVVVGSFCNTYYMAPDEMVQSLQKYSLNDLRQAGFTI